MTNERTEPTPLRGQHGREFDMVGGDATARVGPCTSSALSPQKLQCVQLRHLLVCITGSISAAFMPAALLWLRQNAALESLRVVLSANASRMVSRNGIEAVIGGPVAVDYESHRSHFGPEHVFLTKDIDAVVVMPATANILAKASHGIADDLVSSCIVAATCPVLFVPGMNPSMWQRGSVQRNVEVLRSDGCLVLEPVTGYSVADGTRGEGGISQIVDVHRALMDFVTQKRF